MVQLYTWPKDWRTILSSPSICQHYASSNLFLGSVTEKKSLKHYVEWSFYLFIYLFIFDNWHGHRIFFSIIFIYLFIYFYFTILYWFCHTLTWIHHGCTCVLHPIPLGHPSEPVLSTLCHTSNLDWLFISHMIIYMF